MNFSHQTLVEYNYVLVNLFSLAAVLGEPGFSAEVVTWAIVQAAEKPGALDLGQKLLTPGTHWETFTCLATCAWGPLNNRPNAMCRTRPNMALWQPLWLLYLLALHQIGSHSFIHPSIHSLFRGKLNSSEHLGSRPAWTT